MEYMNGATTDPWVKTTNVLINNIVIIKGANQYFFLTFKKLITFIPIYIFFENYC